MFNEAHYEQAPTDVNVGRSHQAVILTLCMETIRTSESWKYSLTIHGTINTNIKMRLRLWVMIKKTAADYGYKFSARQQQNKIFPPQIYAIQLQCCVQHE